MDDDKTQDMPDSGRAKRAGPTIDLKANEPVTEASPVEADAPAKSSVPPTGISSVSLGALAAASGAAAAALVICAVWLSGWPGQTNSPSSVPPSDTGAIDALTSRVAQIETRQAEAKPAASPDPAAAARTEALEKSIASLRNELTAVHAQSDKAATDIKSIPHDTTPAVDLTALTARITQIEHSDRMQSAEIAQANAKPTDDAPLRRVVVASMLDASVRHGDSYAEALAAAKSVTDNADALKPLDVFASSGVPSAAALSRDLLNLVSKLSPPTPDLAPAGTGFVDRLQAGASRLVRIERTNVGGNDRSAIVARITAAALRNDTKQARRELDTLAPADRTAAQSWIETSDAREAALAASRQFTADAMAALAKAGQ